MQDESVYPGVVARLNTSIFHKARPRTTSLYERIYTTSLQGSPERRDERLGVTTRFKGYPTNPKPLSPFVPPSLFLIILLPFLSPHLCLFIINIIIGQAIPISTKYFPCHIHWEKKYLHK